jgi:3-hydroxybutyrate dehydrogenase
MLKNKVALVTGSTSGIGLAIARAFAEQGADVVLNGFGDAAAIETERAAIEAEFGVKALYFGADMSKGAEIAGMVETAIHELGGVDILVNNAGIQFVSPIEEFPLEKWDQIIAINLSAAFHAIRAALPGMKARGWGRIINTASAHALVASPFKSAYVAAKHGIAGLTKTVALEAAAHGVTCNAICPGYVWTPLVEKQIPDTMAARGRLQRHGLGQAGDPVLGGDVGRLERRGDQVIDDVLLTAQPTKQFVTVDEVAAFAVFLSSDAAKSITGALLSIDGGWTAA